jgi:hypothetical protein
MSIDIHEKAKNLLTEISNSWYERRPTDKINLCFTSIDIELVENWLHGFLIEVESEIDSQT